MYSAHSSKTPAPKQNKMKQKSKETKNVDKQVEDPMSKIARQSFEEFTVLMRNNQDRAIYGEEHIKVASELGAIDKLLISETVYSSFDVLTKRTYKKIFKKIESSGGKIIYFIKDYPSTEELNKLTGIVATLYYPLPNIDDNVT